MPTVAGPRFSPLSVSSSTGFFRFSLPSAPSASTKAISEAST
jgi:hypothetical protein